jgi:outer membrane protein OmpA-like peptidoglycan-associated protein
VIAWLVAALVPALFGQTEQPTPVKEQITITAKKLVLSYPEGKTVTIKLQGTPRLPKARGEAKVQRKKGTTEIEIELDEMKPARLFGGDFNTYVLWAVSPEGFATNIGEFILDGNRSKLDVTTPLQTFGVFISAEPHFLVQYPSRFFVLENIRPIGNLSEVVRGSEIQYQGYVGVYRFDRESLDQVPEAKGEVRTELQQARTAIALAERAKAQQYATVKLTQARADFEKAQQAVRSGSEKTMVANLEKAAIRTAYEAQQDAEAAAVEAAQEAERKAQEAEEARLRQAEEAAQRQAKEAAAQAQQAEAEAQRAAREREEARTRMKVALAQVAETRESARGLIMNLGDVLFDFNQATLQPAARDVINRIAGILEVTGGFRLQIEGYTDSIGSDEYNQKLSEQRAQAVSDSLVAAGVSPDLISTAGFGKSNPIADNSTEEGRRKNRRVEIVVQDATQNQ